MLTKLPFRNLGRTILKKNFLSTVSITFFEESSGDRIAVDAKIGASVLEAAVSRDVDIEGACGGELACSTCHVILSKQLYDTLPPKSEEEQDMLDLAWGIKPT